MVGNVGMFDATANTWFGDDQLYVHMINCIPITAVSSLLLEENYIKYEYPFLMSNHENVEMAWRGYTVSVHSIIEPNKAWKEASALKSNQLDSALSKSQVLYFISQQSGFNVTLNGHNTKQQHLNNRTSRNTPSPSMLDGTATHTKMNSSISTTTTSSSSCERNPSCVESNLVGMCCPTVGGTFLDCCNG